MPEDWKTSTAVLEDWEDEPDDWPFQDNNTSSEEHMVKSLAEGFQQLWPEKDLPDFDPARQEAGETRAEFQLRELKAAFNTAWDSINCSADDRREAQQNEAQIMADRTLNPNMLPAGVEDTQDLLRFANGQLAAYLADPTDTIPPEKITSAVNAAGVLFREDRQANYDSEWSLKDSCNPAEARLLERLTLAFRDNSYDCPEFNPENQQYGETQAEFRLRELQASFQAAALDRVAGMSPEAAARLENAAARDLVRNALGPNFDRWRDPENIMPHAVAELADYLKSDYENPERALDAFNYMAARFPNLWGQDDSGAAAEQKSLEHLLESNAVDYRETSPEVARKLAEFAEKLLDFRHEPEAVYERRRSHGYTTDTFTQDRPETLILKSLDIANHEMTFNSLAERREFAEHAAAALIDELLGGNAETRKLLAGSFYQTEPGWVDSAVTESREDYAQAEASFKELLIDQLSTYRPAWTQHIPEEQVPQRYAYILKTLQGQLEVDPDQDPADFLSPAEAAKRMEFQREHFSHYTEARAYNEYGITLPHDQHEQVPDFTMARYLEPPWYLRNADESQIEKWQRECGLPNWEPEDHVLLQETLQVLTERYSGTALHKDELSNNFPMQCMDDLKQVFHNQSFASAEHRRQEAAAVADAIIPADDPLLREWNRGGWQASAEANRLLQEFLNEERYGLNHYYRIANHTAIARQARQETQDFLRELAAVPA